MYTTHDAVYVHIDLEWKELEIGKGAAVRKIKLKVLRLIK